ncbi:MAG: hypothetical protein ACOC9Y_03565, partial [Chloroflexota bacterium]
MADSASNSDREGRTYEPGPSFLEGDRPNVRLAELPAWLQTFAASTGEPEPTSQAPAPADEETLPPDLSEPDAQDSPHDVEASEQQEEESPAAGLPGWLEEPRPESPGTPAEAPPPGVHSDDSDSFMI